MEDTVGLNCACFACIVLGKNLYACKTQALSSELWTGYVAPILLLKTSAKYVWMSKKFDSGVARGQPQALSLTDFCLPFTGHLFKSDQETFARKPSTLQYSLCIPWYSLGQQCICCTRRSGGNQGFVGVYSAVHSSVVCWSTFQFSLGFCGFVHRAVECNLGFCGSRKAKSCKERRLLGPGVGLHYSVQ